MNVQVSLFSGALRRLVAPYQPAGLALGDDELREKAYVAANMPNQVKCSACGLVQFDPPGSPCRRCRAPLGNEVSESLRPRPPASGNPYQPPATHHPSSAQAGLDRETLKDIARGQRLVIHSILAQFSLILFVFVGGAVLPKAVAGVILLVGFVGAAGLSIYGTFALAKALYSVGAAIGLLFLSMFLGFLLLLYLSAQANRRFREAGIRVGMLGVPASEFA